MKKLFRNTLATFIAFLFVLSSCVIPVGILAAEDAGATKGDFVSCSISLGTDITVNYKVRISDSLVRLDADGNTANVSVKFTFTGVNTRESEVKGTKLKDSKGNAVADMYLFRFTGVNPQCMGDVLSAQLVIDGTADAKAKDMTVKDYCMELIKGSTDEKVKEFARDCCMHLAAFTPAYNKQEDVPAEYINEQKEIFAKQMEDDPKMASKPQNVKDGILQGKINKHLAEICFVDQMFVKDDKKSVKAKLDEVGKSVGATLEFVSINLLLLGK